MNNVLFTEEEIQTRVESLAIQLSYHKNPENAPRVLICVLNGAFMFFADLVKHLKVDCEVDFIKAKSYQGTQQSEVAILHDVTMSLAGKDIFIIDDILDSGNTMRTILAHLKRKGCKSITPVTLFKRQHAYMEDLIYGFELENEAWLTGYGLDATNGFKRNQKFITGTLMDE
jgi:hypoxanthine phosphoribosyltransferase